MADTTRPFHWGRENPNYTGPQRATSASSAAGTAPSGDFDAPGETTTVPLDDLDAAELMDAYRAGEDPLEAYIAEREEDSRRYLRGDDDHQAEATYREHADLRSLRSKLSRYAADAEAAEVVDRSTGLNAEAVQAAAEGVRRVDGKIVIGYVAVNEPFDQTEHFETAAWYQDHTVTPGVYPVLANFRDGGDSPDDAYVRYDTTKGRSNFQALAGGVSIGQAYDNQSTSGQSGTVDRSMYGYNLPSADGATGFGGNVFYCSEVDLDWSDELPRYRQTDVPNANIRVRLARDKFPPRD